MYQYFTSFFTSTTSTDTPSRPRLSIMATVASIIVLFMGCQMLHMLITTWTDPGFNALLSLLFTALIIPFISTALYLLYHLNPVEWPTWPSFGGKKSPDIPTSSDGGVQRLAASPDMAQSRWSFEGLWSTMGRPDQVTVTYAQVSTRVLPPANSQELVDRGVDRGAPEAVGGPEIAGVSLNKMSGWLNSMATGVTGVVTVAATVVVNKLDMPVFLPEDPARREGGNNNTRGVPVFLPEGPAQWGGRKNPFKPTQEQELNITYLLPVDHTRPLATSETSKEPSRASGSISSVHRNSQVLLDRLETSKEPSRASGSKVGGGKKSHSRLQAWQRTQRQESRFASTRPTRRKS